MQKTSLKIAGIQVDLLFEIPAPKLAPIFNPYLISSANRMDKGIQIRYSKKSPPGFFNASSSEIYASGTSATSYPEGVLFRRHKAKFLASHDFLKGCVYQSTRIVANLDSYEGSPWLILFLWGWISTHRGILHHGALVSIDGLLVLFLGPSGAGKTTLSKIVVEAGGSCITEENPVITVNDNIPLVHGTPWPGSFGPVTQQSGPISAIFFLRHSIENSLTLLSQQEAARRMINNARFFSWLPNTIPDCIEIIHQTISSTPVYDFGFEPKASALKSIQRVL